MIFASLGEVQLAYALGKVDTHAQDQGALAEKPLLARAKWTTTSAYGKIIDTTVGRVIFNTILPDGMPFYNIAHALERTGQRDFATATSSSAAARRSTCSTT